MKFRKLFTYSVVSVAMLLTSADAKADNISDALTRFAGNIHQFGQIFPQEKVYVQFDNTSYYTGETIWFKAYVVNAADNRRAESKVLYVDLLSPGGVVLKTQKLKVVAGQCDGSFPLYDASTNQARELRGVLPYPSGFYEIRAYTMNMLNFSQEAIFSRVFPIYEKPEQEGGYYDESPSIKLHDSFIEQYRPKTKDGKKFEVSFYPEGGHLIIGQPCRVAFKVTGSNGLGIDAAGSVDASGEKIQTVHDGMGSFTITPQEKSNSITLTDSEGRSHSFNMPDAEKSGYAFHLDNLGDSILVTIACTGELTGDSLGITVTCRDGLVSFTTLPQRQNDEIKSVIPVNCSEGVCRAVLFDRSGNILASRSFYHESAQPAPQLTFQADRSKYGPFQEIKLDFTLKDGSGQPFRDRFCLSVRDSRTSGNLTSGDLRTTLLLSSDLRGYVHNPEWYFETSDESRLTALDLLTMIQGWERYDWKVMAGLEKFEEKHRTEQNLTLNGWVLSPNSDKPISDIKVMAAIVPPDKQNTEQFNCITDSTGYFGLDISDFYDIGRLTIHTTQKKRLIGTSSRILFERSMTPEIRAYYPAETVLRNIGASTKISKSETIADEPDDNMPEVIWDNIGYLLPDVDIEDKRKYIDYFTFKAFDVQHDLEAELDRAEFSGDVLGYLLEKGFSFSLESDSSEAADFSPQLYGSDEEVAMQLADMSLLNGAIHAFWYVHDSRHCLYQGIYCPPWSIDAQDIKSLMVYDRVMPLTSILTLAPLFTEGLDHHVSVGFKQEAETDITNYYLIDMQVKDYENLTSRKDLMEIGKRISTVTGYSSPYQFYSPAYPDGPIPGDVDYRRTIYWDPNVITDADGHATVSFYNSSITSDFNVSGAGITAGGQPYILESGF